MSYFKELNKFKYMVLFCVDVNDQTITESAQLDLLEIYKGFIDRGFSQHYVGLYSAPESYNVVDVMVAVQCITKECEAFSRLAYNVRLLTICDDDSMEELVTNAAKL